MRVANIQQSTGPYDTDTQHDTAQRPVIQQTAKRDEWMTMAPAQDELAARMDPSRVRARGFNTRGGGSVAGRASDASAWHETAEQKQRRLADEVMGIKKDKPATASGSHASSKSGLIQATAGKAAMPKVRLIPSYTWRFQNGHGCGSEIAHMHHFPRHQASKPA